MAKKPTFADKQKRVERLEKSLKDDEAAVKAAREAMREAARTLENAEQQVFYTRKALIEALNELHK